MWNNKCTECAPYRIWMSATEATECPDNGAHTAFITSINEG